MPACLEVVTGKSARLGKPELLIEKFMELVPSPAGTIKVANSSKTRLTQIIRLALCRKHNYKDATRINKNHRNSNRVWSNKVGVVKQYGHCLLGLNAHTSKFLDLATSYSIISLDYVYL